MKNEVVIFLLCAAAIQGERMKNLKLFAEWKDLEFAFPTQAHRQAAIGNGEYISGRGVPIDVDIDYRAHGLTRVFVTIPRFTTGIPVTLGVITPAEANGGPIIQPFPYYELQNMYARSCDGITSVFRVKIDECRRLWVLDTGRIGERQYCPPQLLIYNLDNDALIHRYQFPSNQFYSGVSLFITPVVDVFDPPPGGQCINTHVYIADVTGSAILVYDARQNRSWRVQNKLMFPHPTYGTFNIAGESFDLMDGVLGMALSPRPLSRGRAFEYFHSQNHLDQPAQNDRTLFFHALASATENSVRTSILKNYTAWEQNAQSMPREFYEIGTRRTQSAAQAMDKHGNLFFGLMDPIAIACWDSEKPYNAQNTRIVAQNDATLQFASGMKVIQNGKGDEELWVLTCRFQKVMTGTMNRNEVNFRIQAIKVDELLGAGNKCIGDDHPHHPHQHQHSHDYFISRPTYGHNIQF